MSREVHVRFCEGVGVQLLRATHHIVHCHILDHEDNDMMRPIKVLGPDFAVEADLGSEWRRSSWFGTYFEGNYATFSPWIYHQQHGHLYVMEVSDRGGEGMFWLYDQRLGWLWMLDQVYPYVYCEESQSWLYYLPGSVNPRWFYDFGTGDWLSRSPS